MTNELVKIINKCMLRKYSNMEIVDMVEKAVFTMYYVTNVLSIVCPYMFV